MTELKVFARHSAFEHAFQHCPSALFSFVTDQDAVNIANASSYLSNVCKRSYGIKRELPIRCVLAGLYPYAASNVLIDCSTDKVTAAMLPSSVTSLSLTESENAAQNAWRVSDLPRSLTRFSLRNGFGVKSCLLANVSAAEDWPPGLTSLELRAAGQAPPLPPNLRALAIIWLEVEGVQLPESLTSLRIATDSDCSELLLRLPSHLTTLEAPLSQRTTTGHLSRLPVSLTHLELCNSYNNRGNFDTETGSVDLPPNLRYLGLECVPCRVFRQLPSSLEHLIVDIGSGPHTVGPPIRHAALQSLKLPYGYNQPVETKHLPSLRKLSLASGFHQPLNDFPSNLTDLELDLYSYKFFESPALDCLPSSLTRLELSGSSLMCSLDHLPSGITELDLQLSVYRPLDRLPRCLRSLTLGSSFNQPLDALPDGLTFLSFLAANLFDQPLNRLPDSLQELHLPTGFNRPLQRLPSSLRVLWFDSCTRYNHPLPALPDSLSVLRLGFGFDQPLPRLPRGLTELRLGDYFNQPLPLVELEPKAQLDLSDQQSERLSSTEAKSQEPEPTAEPMTYPAALRSLEIRGKFNQPLALPRSLTELSFRDFRHSPCDFNQPLPLSSLSSSLTYLRLPQGYGKRYPEWKDEAAIRQQCPFVHLDTSGPERDWYSSDDDYLDGDDDDALFDD